MKKILLFCCFSLLACFAVAQTDSTKVLIGGSWTAPTEREGLDASGKPIKLDALKELGGYEFQYRKVGATDWTSVKLPVTQLANSISLPYGNYEARVAAYDLQNLYSAWVTLTTTAPNTPPKPPGNFKITITLDRLVITGNTATSSSGAK